MAGTRILVVDDDASVRLVISEALRRDGYDVVSAGSLAEAKAAQAGFVPDLVITDVVLPDGDGLDTVPALLAERPQLPVIVVSAQNTLTTAVRARERGAFEYLPKPFDLNELRRAVREGVAGVPEPASAAPLERELPLIGRSPAMQEVYRALARVVATDLTVLLLGESGTGKELVARAIHEFSPRARGPFVAINTAAIPRELIESELFGHERGAFTGASTRSAGRFAQAAGGTLFLDEIGDMPPEAQTRLLRVLQAREYSPVGGGSPVATDVRVVCATHQDLPAKIAAGEFREDLFYRLNVVPIALPPLRARGDDLALLAQAFLDRAAVDGLPRKHLSPGAVERLAMHDWPGNVRELENLMRRLAAMTRERTIGASHINAQLAVPTGGSAAAPLRLEAAVANWLSGYFSSFGEGLPPTGLHARVTDELERALFRATLQATRGNQLRAAALLGLNRNTLRKRLTELGLPARE